MWVLTTYRSYRLSWALIKICNLQSYWLCSGYSFLLHGHKATHLQLWFIPNHQPSNPLDFAHVAPFLELTYPIPAQDTFEWMIFPTSRLVGYVGSLKGRRKLTPTIWGPLTAGALANATGAVAAWMAASEMVGNGWCSTPSATKSQTTHVWDIYLHKNQIHKPNVGYMDGMWIYPPPHPIIISRQPF